MPARPTRADTYHVSVTIAGHQFGTFDYMEGGEVDSDAVTFREGNMADPISLGGHRMVTNVIVRRLYKLERDHAWSQNFINWAGNADMVVVKQPKDINKMVYGKPITYRGTMKRAKFPTHDSTSTAPEMLEIEMIVEGFPTGMSQAA